MAQLLVAVVVAEGFYYSYSWTLREDLHNDFGYNQIPVVMMEKAGIHIDDYPQNIFHDLNLNYSHLFDDLTRQRMYSSEHTPH